MSSQKQNISESQIENSQIQLLQATGDAFGFQNSHENRVTINRAFVQLFNQSEPSGVDWDWDWGQQLLVKKQLPDLRKRLNDVLLQNRTLMEVSIEEQFTWVNRSPLETERRLQIQGEDRGVISDQLLIETFSRDDISGKLLILGAPGAGKTTALLGLAEQVVMGAIAHPKTVIPVLFELSAWRDENQSIEQWLIEQLYELHGGNRRAKPYEQWLERQVLLPLLDGLDELGLERQKKCTQKLNEFARHYPQMVVCCRVKEFETVGIKLTNLNGAVCLQPLSDPQIQDYLHHIKSDLWNAITTVPAMQMLMQPTEEGEPGLLRIPLFISLAAQVYDSLAPFQNEAELLVRYVERRLSIDLRESERRRGLEKSKWAYKTTSQEPDCPKTKRYLSWMARQLRQRNQVELLIEQIQPSWMEAPRLLHQYSLIFGALFGAILGAPFGLIYFAIWGAIYFALFGAIFSRQIINPVESFRIPRSRTERLEILRKLIWKLIWGLIPGLIGVLIGVLSFVLTSGRISGLVWGLWGLMGVLIIALIDALRQDLKVRSRPNQGIWNSLQSSLWMSAVIGTVVIVFVASQLLIRWVREKQALNNLWGLNKLWDLAPAIAFGFYWTLFVGFFIGGGTPCLQHLSLRFVLWQSGIAPWNLAQFLNYCTERRLLQRVGGRYRFIHRELLNHFANSRF